MQKSFFFFFFCAINIRLEGHFDENFRNFSFTRYYYELETWQHCSPCSGSELYRCRFVREWGVTLCGRGCCCVTVVPARLSICAKGRTEKALADSSNQKVLKEPNLTCTYAPIIKQFRLIDVRISAMGAD